MKDHSFDHIIIGYSILFFGLWFIDLSGLHHAPEWLISLVETAKWVVTIPVILLATAWTLLKLITESENSRSRPLINESARLKALEQQRLQRTLNNPVPIPQYINIEPAKPTPEKREAEKTLERTAFPLVEKTRGAQEALEASLAEF